MDIDRSAPIQGRESIDIAAPADRVWRIMTDVERWPGWNPQIGEARLEGPLEPGTRFRWRAGSSRITSVLRSVAPPRELGWSGKTMGIHAEHVWRIEPTPTGVRVTTEESWRGWPTRLMKKRMARTLDEALVTGLASLKAEAEREASEQGSEGTGGAHVEASATRAA